MKSTCLALAIVGFCLSMHIHAQSNSEEWKLKLEKSGVSVYMRAVAGSKIRESKAEAKIQASVDELTGLYLNPEKCASWFPSCKTAKLLEQKSESNLVVYREISIPWPFKNQEYVLNQEISRTAESGEVIVTFNILKDYPTGTKCCKRYRSMKGSWTFTPAANHVLVTYQVHFVPAGSFPASAINSEIPGMLVEALTSLQANVGI